MGPMSMNNPRTVRTRLAWLMIFAVIFQNILPRSSAGGYR
jgi:hypothetical protein